MRNDPTPQFVRHLYVTLSTNNASDDGGGDAVGSDHASASLTWDATAPQRFVVHSTPALLDRILETRRGGFGCSTVATFMRKLQVHGFRHVDDRRTCHAPLVCGVYEYARGTFYRGCFAVQSSEEFASRQTESMSIPLSTPSSISATTDGESLSMPDCSRTTEENDQPSDMRVVEASVTNITASPRVVIVDEADGACRDTKTDSLAPQEKTTTTSTTTTTTTTAAAAEPPYNVGAWSTEEHARYLKAMASATRGIRKWSWKEIAQQIGTRSTRQVMTHHQKYLAKQRRHQSQQLELPPQSPPDNLSILVLASTLVSRTTANSDPERASSSVVQRVGTGELSRGDGTDAEDDGDADDKDDPFRLHHIIRGTFRSPNDYRSTTADGDVSGTSGV